jgi:chromatin segregation and condensation protein Rec8/ScpA/Scc1 (kleisin family)
VKPELKIVVSNAPQEPAVAQHAPEQVEMPFAMVNGEPVTQLPRDLYIPPQALEVFLEAFEGPLDLLLYLIRRQNLDILDIPLAEITRQYMKYIELMQDLQLELAGEYMVMAATLAEIKSRMLLPRPTTQGDGSDEDPRAELVRRLQEYERFKRAAENIDTLPRLERDVWAASAELKDRKVVRLLPQVTLQEMLVAFKEVVVRSEMFAHHHIQRERLSVRERMGDILSSLEQSSFVEFVRLFRPEEGRMGITVTFVAILELVREGLIDIVQAEPFAPLHVRAAAPNRHLRVVSPDGSLEETAAAERAVGEDVAMAEGAHSIESDDVALTPSEVAVDSAGVALDDADAGLDDVDAGLDADAAPDDADAELDADAAPDDPYADDDEIDDAAGLDYELAAREPATPVARVAARNDQAALDDAGEPDDEAATVRDETAASDSAAVAADPVTFHTNETAAAGPVAVAGDSATFDTNETAAADPATVASDSATFDADEAPAAVPEPPEEAPTHE